MLTDFRLQVFVLVARLLSFTRAAEELNISQPAVTKHIKELEKIAGGALFLRKGSSIILTSKGLSLLPLATEVLRKYDALNDSIAKSKNIFAGVIRIGASTTIAQYVLPSILAKFRHAYPEIRVILTAGNSAEVSRALTDECLDIALVEDDTLNHSLHYEKFADDRIVLLSALSKTKRISVNDIPKLPLVIREFGSGTLSVIENALSKHHIFHHDLNIIMQFGSSEGIIRYLLQSNVYAFISIAAAHDYLQRGQLHIVETDGLQINRTFRFVSLHGESNRLTELFKQFCLSNYNF